MNSPLKDWREKSRHGVESAARAIGVTAAMWSRWENGRRKIPAERCLEVERLTGVSRYILRPDVYGPAPAALEAQP
ncbi:YdaS family helix-turn-helix protein [Devosia sp. 63-57]|uniref:transcriptional regulator n=1 Tax=Devosia sp. 63-57 TaxID=1895751 RepID=UPI00257B7FCA|nr:YdaS family helix-turn-helix protein [Devosia sp. 63-57]